MRIAALASLALLAAAADAAPKASFDCTKAAAPVEKLICSDQEIAKLDQRMATTFGTLVAKHPGEADWLREGQRTWLRQRLACEKDAKCLNDLYRERLAALENKSVVCAPPKMTGEDFSLTCKALDNPLRLTFAVTGRKNNNDAEIHTFSVAKAGGKPQTFKVEGQNFFGSLPGGIELIDVNFDGYADIKLLTATSIGPNAGYDWWLYDPQTGGFAHSDIGDVLAGMDVWTDAKAKTISVNNRGSCCMWNVSTYAWRGRNLRPVISKNVGAFTPVDLPRANDQEICGNQTEYFNEAGLLTRIDIDLDRTTQSPGECERDQLAAQQGLLAKLKAKPVGYHVEAKDKGHYTIIFDKPRKTAY